MHVFCNPPVYRSAACALQVTIFLSLWSVPSHIEAAVNRSLRKSSRLCEVRQSEQRSNDLSPAILSYIFLQQSWRHCHLFPCMHLSLHGSSLHKSGLEIF